MSLHEARRWSRIGRVLFTLVVLGLFLTCSSAALAQTVSDQRVWAGVSMQGQASGAWRWSIEAFARSRDGVEELDTVAFRPTVTYALGERSSAGGGYLIGASYPASGGATIEQRVFGQYIFSTRGLGGSVTLRTRLESRFIEGNSGPLGRFRQQVRYSRRLGSGPVSLVVSDEIFLHLNDTTRSPRGVDQNRIFAGVSVAVGAAARIEAGYLNQFSPGHRGAADRMNHVVSLNLGLTF